MNNKEKQYPEHIIKYAEALEGMFEKYDIQLQDNATFYKGVTNAEMLDILSNVKNVNGKQLYKLVTFKNVSLYKDLAQSFADEVSGWVFIIKARKGSRMFPLTSFSEYPEQGEFMIQNGLHFEIDNIDVDKRIVDIYLLSKDAR
ncbi:hypothetical protein [Staphylococcus auricularis]|uniref:ADP-ribosyltransferase n=1 Tax=Staphylococcus auricularis TaxID=29379 RepID=A0AAW7MCU8_9STAP|nr:hypothetical protein [Staphylococcus auricularis]MDC6327183.1 hypothetical protein [Staphylococcus auricularis]MDN4533107.1 hypothetical protein [Staphylococcus auricularis]MDN4533391.1 hypothetical protein [Staphylococcus auricularis]